MTSVWQLPALIGAILAWLSTPPVSLADVARHEAVRRALTAPAAATYTNETLPSLRPSDIGPPPDTSVGDPSPPAPAGAAPKEFPAFERPPDDVGGAPAAGDEKAWRARFSGLSAAVERDRMLAAGLQSRITALQNDVLRRDDPAQRALLAQELAKTLAELDRMTATVEGGQAALDKLRDEARRRGVPPGWVRP